MKLKRRLGKPASVISLYRANLRNIIILCVISLIIPGIFGCYRGGGTGATLQQDGKLVFQRLAIAPFQQTTPEQIDINAADCSQCVFFARAEGLPDRPEAIIEQIFVEKLNAGYKTSIIPSDRVAGMYERYIGAFDKVTPLAVLKKVGTDLEVDGIVFGYVYRFRERQGTPYAAVKPASVAFEIYLFRVGDAALVWKGHFDKTQTSLMENVLQASAFLKGGGRWVTAKELSEGGMDNIMTNFPALSK